MQNLIKLFSCSSKKKYRFNVTEYSSYFVVSGKVEDVMLLVSSCIGTKVEIFANYGYIVKTLESTNKVIFLNFDVYTSKKWSQIWH